MGLDKSGIPDSLSGDWNKGPLQPSPGKRRRGSHAVNPLDLTAPSSRDRRGWEAPAVATLPISAKIKNSPRV